MVLPLPELARLPATEGSRKSATYGLDYMEGTPKGLSIKIGGVLFFMKNRNQITGLAGLIN
jgi:hypothetical protein